MTWGYWERNAHPSDDVEALKELDREEQRWGKILAEPIADAVRDQTNRLENELALIREQVELQDRYGGVFLVLYIALGVFLGAVFF